MDFLKGVRAVGFDLDQTLYPDSAEIQERVRTEIARRILEKRPIVGDIDGARSFFEERYRDLGSGSKVLAEVGYEQPVFIMDECLTRADILDFIQENPILVNALSQLRNKYEILFLITSSPEYLALSKLQRLGIDHDVFNYAVYSTTEGAGRKSTGRPFSYIQRLTRIPCANHLYIGDSLYSDIIPAKSFGMRTGAVWSTVPEADFSILTINDLERILL